MLAGKARKGKGIVKISKQLSQHDQLNYFQSQKMENSIHSFIYPSYSMYEMNMEDINP